jgi:hypothetical protein
MSNIGTEANRMIRNSYSRDTFVVERAGRYEQSGFVGDD